MRCPRAQLAATWAAGEIGIGLGRTDDLNSTLNTHLHAIAHPRPMKQQRCLRIGLQLAPLALSLIHI